ncbi:MAG: hypothetical protein GAK35_00515 [Herbaspirillum frisingense]|uniref:Type II secretion system protein GspC N-terminal domain-containing protein n=1 Tax=Herbaspirillum frisingense TaxID=92645 RepID=A0A7V8FZP7_9BURK|nr:MAG: hypothetical protein GAK35_00515 [Herbaspirillum frisingense]
MTPSYIAAVLAAIAGALYAAGMRLNLPDEIAATHTWIAAEQDQAARQARPALPAAPAPSAAGEDVLALVAMPADPFRLQERSALRRMAAARAARLAAAPEGDDEEGTPASAGASGAPPIRLLGTLQQGATAYAVVEIAGIAHRLRAGDELPAGLGRIVHVREDAMDIANGAATHVLTLDSTETRETQHRTPPSRPARTPRAGKGRLIRPGRET